MMNFGALATTNTASFFLDVDGIESSTVFHFWNGIQQRKLLRLIQCTFLVPKHIE
jgi:fermentation-respiration switch protein FrsA (DUF1100 family)